MDKSIHRWFFTNTLPKWRCWDLYRVAKWRDIETLHTHRKTSDSLKAEKEAIEEAVNLLSNSASNSNIVILTDAKTIIQSLQDPQNTQLNQLRTAFHILNQNTKETVLQWIPGHAKIIGNEIADQLAKSGSRELQEDVSLNADEMKNCIKEQIHQNMDK